MSPKMNEMRFMLFDNLGGCHPLSLAPDVIHLRVNGAERQPRFKYEKHAAVKEEACSGDTKISLARQCSAACRRVPRRQSPHLWPQTSPARGKRPPSNVAGCARGLSVCLTGQKSQPFSRSSCPYRRVFDMSSRRSESARTRSTTRPSREDVERIMLPQAEIKTAGVIIAVSTAVAEMESMISGYENYLLGFVRRCAGRLFAAGTGVLTGADTSCFGFICPRMNSIIICCGISACNTTSLSCGVIDRVFNTD
jgi:hypothetical protein